MWNRDFVLLIVAFAIIYVVWGSTYLINYYAIDTIPPFLMSGSRFIVAGAIMYAISWLRGVPHPSQRQWRNAALSGVLLLAIGTGGVVWAEQYVATSIAALIVASDPLVVVLLLWFIYKQRPRWNSLLGIFLSIAGVSILVGQDQFTADQHTFWGVVVIFGSILSWAFASVFIGKADLPKSTIQVAATQMLAGGVFLLFASGISQEYKSFSWAAISLRSIYAWTYLIVFGSIIAFSAFNYLLTKVSPEKVATSTYVNPVIAMLLGWGFNNEQLTSQSLYAALLILIGVFFINSRSSGFLFKNKKKG